MRRLFLLVLLPWLMPAEDHWVKFTSGPYEVLTDAGAKAGRETMVRFEEFRHALGQIVGEQDLQTRLPVRILVFKNAKGWTSAAPITEGRDRFAIVLEEKGAVSPAVYSELTRLFLKSNTNRMPPAFEHGLVEFFSTFEVNGIHITVGTPPPHPDLDWARIHLLVVDPEYFGSIRVLLYNLRKGVDEDAAYQQCVRQIGQPRSRRRPSSISRPAIFRPEPSPAAPFRRTISRSGRSPTPMRGWRAPTCWPERNRPPNTRRCSRQHQKVAEAEEGLGLLALARPQAGRSPRAISPPPWTPAAPARAATSSTPNWSRITPRPPRRCCKPRASIPSWTSRSP